MEGDIVGGMKKGGGEGKGNVGEEEMEGSKEGEKEYREGKEGNG